MHKGGGGETGSIMVFFFSTIKIIEVDGRLISGNVYLITFLYFVYLAGSIYMFKGVVHFNL